MEGALRWMDVPPDDIEPWLAEQATAQAKLAAKLPESEAAPAAAPGPASPLRQQPMPAGAHPMAEDGAPVPIDLDASTGDSGAAR